MFLSLAITLMVPNRGSALTVEDLYVAEVFVTGQDEEQLRSGAQAALLQVLIRVSGDQDVQQSELIVDALRNPSSPELGQPLGELRYLHPGVLR